MRYVTIALLVTCFADRIYAGEEQAAIEAIVTVGGTIVRENDASDSPIISVRLHDARVTDDVLEKIACLKALRRLSLSQSSITDSGLKYLANFKQLQQLDLTFTDITD